MTMTTMLTMRSDHHLQLIFRLIMRLTSQQVANFVEYLESRHVYLMTLVVALANRLLAKRETRDLSIVVCNYRLSTISHLTIELFVRWFAFIIERWRYQFSKSIDWHIIKSFYCFIFVRSLLLWKRFRSRFWLLCCAITYKTNSNLKQNEHYFELMLILCNSSAPTISLFPFLPFSAQIVPLGS